MPIPNIEDKEELKRLIRAETLAENQSSANIFAALSALRVFGHPFDLVIAMVTTRSKPWKVTSKVSLNLFAVDEARQAAEDAEQEAQRARDVHQEAAIEQAIEKDVLETQDAEMCEK